MGPSGVGKSFWYEKITKQNGLTKPHELVVKNYFNKTYNLSLINKCYKILYNLNIKKKSIENRVFNFIKSSFEISYNKSDLLHIDSFLKGLSNYDDNPINQLRLACYYFEKIKEHKLYENYLNKYDYFLSEDGIVHTNFGNLFRVEKEIKLPDLILNFKSTDAYILKNRQTRIRKGNSNLIEQMLDGAALNNFIKNYNRKYKTKIEKLKEENVTVFDLNVENEIHEKEIINKIISFLDRKNLN